MMRRGEKMEERADMKADGKPAERLTGRERFLRGVLYFGVAVLCVTACHGMSAEEAERLDQEEMGEARRAALEEAVAQKDDWLGRSEAGEEYVLREDLQEALFEGIRAAKIDADTMEELVLRLPVAPFVIASVWDKDFGTPVRGYWVRYIIESSLSKPGNDREIFLEFTPEGVLELIRTEGFALFDVEECDIKALVREYLTPENGELNIVYRYHYPKGRLAAVLGRTRPTLEEERERARAGAAHFAEAIAGADTVWVRGMGGNGEASCKGPVVFETADPAEIEALGGIFRFDADAWDGWLCACLGKPTFEWRRGGRTLAQATFLGASQIRWEGGDLMPPFAAGAEETLVAWMEERGIPHD